MSINPARIFVMALAVVGTFAHSIANAVEVEKPALSITHIRGSVYLLQDPWANVVASIGDDGIILVDAGLTQSPRNLMATLRSTTDKPLKYVINTHWDSHYTHNTASFDFKVPEISHKHLRDRSSANRSTPAKTSIPDIVFEQELTLRFNGEDIHLLKTPKGHSDGDLIVYFEKSNVAHMGDLFMSPYVGFIDPSDGGTLRGLIDALEFAVEKLPEDVTLIPDHGITASYANLLHGLAFLKAVSSVVEQGIQNGDSLTQISSSSLLHEWQNTPGMGFTVSDYVAQFYREYTTP